MNYADAMEAPINLKVGEREVPIKPLTQRDYLPWLSELTQAQRESDRKLVPPTMKPAEKFDLMRRIEMSEIIPADLEPKMFTAQGAIKVIQLALVKAGIDAGEADRFIDSRSVKANEELAVRVSGLFSQERIAAMYDPPPDPPPGEPNPNAQAPAATGANSTTGV
jgi:hypothetical protein